jgi:hypothetical protein
MPMMIKSFGSSSSNSLSDYDPVDEIPQPRNSSFEKAGLTIKEKALRNLKIAKKKERRESFRPQMDFIALTGQNFNKTFQQRASMPANQPLKINNAVVKKEKAY